MNWQTTTEHTASRISNTTVSGLGRGGSYGQIFPTHKFCVIEHFIYAISDKKKSKFSHFTQFDEPRILSDTETKHSYYRNGTSDAPVKCKKAGKRNAFRPCEALV